MGMMQCIKIFGGIVDTLYDYMYLCIINTACIVILCHMYTAYDVMTNIERLNEWASTPKNSNCSTNYYGVGPTGVLKFTSDDLNSLKYNLI